ncbi:MAG: hypothetical protein PH343_00990 [Nitrospira sp.]|nr:hypothetical protein [Nitrospira sp.]
MSCKNRFYRYIVRFRPVFLGLIFIYLIPVISLTGCGGKTILTEDAVKIRNIHDYVNKLKDLYEQHDEQLASMFTQEHFSKVEKDAILQDFSKYNNIHLKVFIDKIQINKGNVDVTIHWNGTWKENEKAFLAGGSMVLLLQYEDTIKVTGIKGDSPFGISRSIMEKH